MGLSKKGASPRPNFSLASQVTVMVMVMPMVAMVVMVVAMISSKKQTDT